MKATKAYISIYLFIITICLSLNSLAINNENPTSSHPKITDKNKDFKTIKWLDLIPQDDLDAIINPPSYVANVEDGTLEDKISSQLQSSIESAADDRYQQALVSTKVIPEMNNQSVRIPGFVVPLEYNDKKAVTQFFLVPYFGACIHVPPPPPNQIIFVSYPKGLKLEALYLPFWISGILKTSIVENEVATSAYALQMLNVEEYKE